MKATIFHFISLAVLMELSIAAKAGAAFPEIIPLPDEWGPEGIEVGRGTDFYAGARHLSAFAGKGSGMTKGMIVGGCSQHAKSHP